MTDTTPTIHVEFGERVAGVDTIPIRWHETVKHPQSMRTHTGPWSHGSEGDLRRRLGDIMRGGPGARRVQAMLEARVALNKAEIEGTRIVEGMPFPQPAVVHPWGPTSINIAEGVALNALEVVALYNDPEVALNTRAMRYMIAEVLQVLRVGGMLPAHCTDERSEGSAAVGPHLGNATGAARKAFDHSQGRAPHPLWDNQPGVDLREGLRKFGEVIREMQGKRIQIIDPTALADAVLEDDPELDEVHHAAVMNPASTEPKVTSVEDRSDPLGWIVRFEDGYAREVTSEEFARAAYIAAGVAAIQQWRDESAKCKAERDREAEIDRRARTMYEAVGYTHWSTETQAAHTGWIRAARIEAELEELRRG